MKSGWQRKKVREIAQHSLGKMLDRAKNKGQPLPYLRNTNVRWFEFDLSELLEMRFLPVETAKYTAIRGDLLICEGGYPGRAAIWDQDYPIHFQKALHRVRFNQPQHTKWFLYYLHALDLAGTLRKHFSGTGIQHFTGEALAEFEMPLAPLPELERIVGIIDEAFDRIATAKANAEKNLKNARALFESQLQTVFAQCGESWATKRLGDVVVRLTNGYVGPIRNIYQESGVPYLLARHVKSNRLLFDGKTFISDKFNRKNKKSMLKAGDVLLVQSGHIGHSAVVTDEHEGHNCHAMIVITPVKDILTGPFLSLFFLSSGMKRKFEEIRSGSTVPHLTCGAVRELPIALPRLPAQRQMVASVEEIRTETERLESIYQQKLAALEALKQSLLHQAFTGAL